VKNKEQLVRIVDEKREEKKKGGSSKEWKREPCKLKLALNSKIETRKMKKIKEKRIEL